MAPTLPYTYIQCPCSDPSSEPLIQTNNRTSDVSTHTKQQTTDGDDDDDDRTFDPRAPRSNYSLYPLEHLLYCDDCHEIRCPRCVATEVAAYYCPNCLFEVPSSNLKSEGNRCTRSCFQCPICVGPLLVTSAEPPPETSSSLQVPGGSGGETTTAAAGSSGSSSGNHQHGPYILTCSYCSWSSTEIGIKFDKPNGIFSQLARVHNGGQPRLTTRDQKELFKEKQVSSAKAPRTSAADLDAETHFAALKAFYQTQLAETSAPGLGGPGGGPGGLSALGDLGLSSPGSLSRIMSLYTGGGLLEKHRRRGGGVMREAQDADEGLKVADGVPPLPTASGNDGAAAAAAAAAGRTTSRTRTGAGLDDAAGIAQLRRGGWDGTASGEQQRAQACAHGEALPARFAADLRPVAHLLRSKRSKRCPVCRHIIAKPEAKVSNSRYRIRLVAANYVPRISVRPLSAPAAQPPVRSTDVGAGPAAPPPTLAPLRPVQFLLTFKNPLFEPVKVTLGAPSATPGRFPSKVTVLCPTFEIAANTDMWDDALRGGDRGAVHDPSSSADWQAEAGKIWQRGRNWVSIVVEVVPARLRLENLGVAKEGGEEVVDMSPLREDEDVLEIPMFVRLEFDVTAETEVGAGKGEKDKEAKERKELAYWCVLGVGRISRE